MDMGKPPSNTQVKGLVHSIGVLSYLEGCPLSIVNKSESLREIISEIASLPQNFDNFCLEMGNDSERWKEIFNKVSDLVFSVSWFNSQQFTRLLRDYRYWRWFEISVILRQITINTNQQIFSTKQFDPLELIYGFSPLSDCSWLVFGPVSHLKAGHHLFDVRKSIDDFHKTLSQTWIGGSDTSSVLYVTDHLIAAIEGRIFTSRSLSNDSLTGLTSMVSDIIKNIELADPALDITHNAALVSMISARHSIESFDIKALSVTSIDQAISDFIDQIRQTTDTSTGRFSQAVSANLSPQLRALLRHRQETGVLSWIQYFHESIAILDHWLSTTMYLSVAPRGRSANDKKIISWDRVCRFMSDLFIASEVTIYRYVLTENNSPLIAVGIHCTGRNGKDKTNRKREFMEHAAANPTLRRKSAAYRAAATNSIQNVSDTTSSEGSGLIIQPSDSTPGEWGRSVLAIPMRMNGGVWGVLEFVSSTPRHFGDLLRSKCEEAADALAATFVNVTVYEVTSKLEDYWADNFGARLGRREELCREISKIFLCDGIKIFTASISNDGQVISMRDFGQWPTVVDPKNPTLFSISDITVRNFIDSGENVLEMIEAPIGNDGKKTDSNRRTFLLRLQAASPSTWAGAVVFSVPYPLAMDSRWRERSSAFAHLVSTIITNLSSDASWTLEIKNVLSHEYRRINEQIKGIKTRLEQRIFKKLPSDEARMADIISSDISDIVNSMDRMSNALLSSDTTSYRINFEDPRGIAVMRAKQMFVPRIQRPISLRELFYQKFIPASNNTQSHGRRVTATGEDYLILMDQATLSDILGTLADNAVKYSTPGSDILMTLNETVAHAVQMTISNLAPSLSDVEKVRIFIDGFRGESARLLFPEKGSGRGLSFAKMAIGIWNGTLRHEMANPEREMSDSHGRPVVWHRFILTFPKSMVIMDHK